MPHQRSFVHSLVAIALTLGVACSGDADSPASPTASLVATEADAAADGSTLKVSAPVHQLPLAGATLDSNTPNLVVTPSAARFAGVTGLTYRFAVDTPAGAEVFRSDAVADVGIGIIASRVAEGRLAWGTAYRWRARAEIADASGVKVGPWSAPAAFETPGEPASPGLDSPRDGATVTGIAPRLKVVNGGLPAGSSATGLVHRFVIESTNGAMVAEGLVPPGSSRTTWATPADTLKPTTTYRWRARLERGAAFVGPWSPYWTFTTSDPVVWPTTPLGIVAYVAEKYPEYLVATGTLHEREVNMQFIRDRVIEVGICGGLDLAWNLKRGVGPRSTDAILHRDPTGGRTRDRVIDIAAGFDAYRSPMQLHWIEVEGPPGYDSYQPRPSCR